MNWELKGTVVVACNCDYGCPCNFNALPTTGKCEGSWTWHVDRGAFGGTSLDDLNFTVAVNWPGAIHEGNGESGILVDEPADQAQAARNGPGSRSEPALPRAVVAVPLPA